MKYDMISTKKYQLGIVQIVCSLDERGDCVFVRFIDCTAVNKS